MYLSVNQRVSNGQLIITPVATTSGRLLRPIVWADYSAWNEAR